MDDLRTCYREVRFKIHHFRSSQHSKKRVPISPPGFWKGVNRGPGSPNLTIVEEEKARISCHSPHHGKISEIKSISKPRLPIEIYTLWEIMLSVDYRKENSMERHQKSSENDRKGSDPAW
jgi:hypothetical protein